jgi:hypothetical protein
VIDAVMCCDTGVGMMRFDLGLKNLDALLKANEERAAAHDLHYERATLTRLLEPALGGNSLLLTMAFFNPLEQTKKVSIRTAIRVRTFAPSLPTL